LIVRKEECEISNDHDVGSQFSLLNHNAHWK